VAIKVPRGIESKTGVRITIPAIPNFFTILIISLLRFVNRFAGINLGIEIFSEL
jgi:hypothetical protein